LRINPKTAKVLGTGTKKARPRTTRLGQAIHVYFGWQARGYGRIYL